jgi:iron complex transport system ATP-binding protein
VNDPQVLVLDEPTAGLDLIARRHFLEAIATLARSRTTLVIVTHRIEEIIPEVSTVVLLRRGRVEIAGSRARVLTADHLSRVFEAPVALGQAGGFLTAVPAGPEG